MPDERPQGLPRSNRLQTRRDFLRVQRMGARGSNGSLSVLVRYVRPGTGRFGLTVSRKVGKAVQRNLLKRRLRHLMRTAHRGAYFGREVVIIAEPGAAELSFEALGGALIDALARADEALKKRKGNKGNKGKGRRGGGRRKPPDPRR